MLDQISRDFFIFNKVHLPPCLSEALCFKCWMSRSRNYLCLHSLREEDRQALPLLMPRDLSACESIFLQHNGSTLVDSFNRKRNQSIDLQMLVS